MYRKLIKFVGRFVDSFVFDSLKIRECPICGWTGMRFRTNWHPIKARFDCVCPKCGSYERHRLSYYLLKDRLKNIGDVFHVAPEPMIEKWLKKHSRSYISGDIDEGSADRKEDLTALSFKDESFDLIYCSHVLEHIPADIEALKEIYRVLKSGGLAIVQVPIWGEESIEGDVSMTAETREKLFFQKDHVRLYGHDLSNRITSCGFRLETLSIFELDQEVVLRHSLNYPSTNEVFLCHKS